MFLPSCEAIANTASSDIHKPTLLRGIISERRATHYPMISCIHGFSGGAVSTHLTYLVSASNSFPLTTQRNTSISLARAHDKSEDDIRRIGGLIDDLASRESTDRLPLSVPALGRSPTTSARVSAAMHDCSNRFRQLLRCLSYLFQNPPEGLKMQHEGQQKAAG